MSRSRLFWQRVYAALRGVHLPVNSEFPRTPPNNNTAPQEIRCEAPLFY